jgi:hypothetical protein
MGAKEQGDVLYGKEDARNSATFKKVGIFHENRYIEPI